MTAWKSLQTYRPAASAIGITSPVGTVATIPTNTWYTVGDLTITDHQIGDPSDYAVNAGSHIFIEYPGIYYVQARANWDTGMGLTGRRLISIEWVDNYFIAPMTQNTIARFESVPSGTAAQGYWTGECSTIFEVPDSFCMVRMNVYQSTGGNFDLTNPGTGNRSELNVRRLS